MVPTLFFFAFTALDPALVGLAMVYLTGMFQHVIRVSADLENLVTAFVYTNKQKLYNNIFRWYQWRG